jgi:hypothetical protein
MNGTQTFLHLTILTCFCGTLFCGSSIKNAQDFLPNKAPVIETDKIILTDTSGSTYTREAIIVGLKVRCTITAHDPENRTLSYSFDSSFGSISNQTITDTGCTVDFLIERINQNNPIILKLIVSDDKKASTAVSIDIGSGQTGVTLTVDNPVNASLSNEGTTTFTFSATGTGWYQILESASAVTDIESAMVVTQKYAVVGDKIATTLTGPGYSGLVDINTLKLSSGDGVKKIWVLFKDGNNYYSSASTAIMVDITSPAVTSTNPTSFDIIPVTPLTLTVTFSENIDASTLTSALLLSGGYYGSIAYQSYDSATCTATYLITGLKNNSSYYAAISGVKDISGNTLSDISPDTKTDTAHFTMTTPDTAVWAQSVTEASGNATFLSTASDGKGNVYAAGYISGTGTFDFGNSITAIGTSTGKNIIIVKYTSDGIARWAQTVTSGSAASCFNSVTVDTNGDVYAAGSITGTGTFDFGRSITAQGTSTTYNIVLVKYTSTGIAKWTKTITAGSDSSFFSVTAATDTVKAVNIYATGYITGTDTYNFGTNSSTVTAAGKYFGHNIVLVKYNSEGIAQWAKSAVAENTESQFNSVVADIDGNIYAAGYFTGTSYKITDSISVLGSLVKQVLLVRYNSAGIAQWGKTVYSATTESQFNSAAMDTKGNIYTAGYITSSSIYDFGHNIFATAATGTSCIIVKYSSNGNAQWAKTSTVPTGSRFSNSIFNSVTVDANDNIFAAGYIYYNYEYNFEDGITAKGITLSNNILLVKYNSSGTTQWAKTTSAGSGISSFSSVTADSTGIYAAGYFKGGAPYTFKNGITITAGGTGETPLLIQY